MAVTERLVFLVKPEHQIDKFLEIENTLWTPWLRQQPGFLHKTVNVVANGQVELLIFWKSKADWDAAAAKKREISTLMARAKNQFPGTIFQLN